MYYKIYVNVMAQFTQVLGFNQIKDIQLGENSDIEITLKKNRIAKSNK